LCRLLLLGEITSEAMRDENTQVNDLITDPRFVQWVQAPDGELVSHWEAWLEANPDKKEVVEAGRQLVAFLHFKASVPSAQEFWAVKEKIKVQIRAEEPEPETPEGPLPEAHQEPFPRYYQLAAVWIAILITGLGTFLYFQTRHTVTHRTHYGETRVIWLPDQSQVTLNANSSIQFDRTWSAGKRREVWLRGEAFFEIRQTAKAALGSSPLVVQADWVQVQALGGEQFNVCNRRGAVKVTPGNGEVELRVPAITPQPLVLRPGDLVEVVARRKKLNRRRMQTGTHSTWRNHLLVLEKTSLQEAARTLEDHYGIPVRIEPAGLAGRRVTGRVPTHNLPVLLTELARQFNVRITRQGNHLVVQSAP